MNETKEWDVLVVGAGPAGLILAKHLQSYDTRFQLIDRGSDVGGVWDIDAPGSPMYDSAHFISSRSLSGIPGFPMPDGYPDYPNHTLVLDYIRSFADTFDLRKHVRLNTQITHAKRDRQGKWKLETKEGETLTARYLICANGVTWEPNLVSWPGNFDGEIRHSITYRSPSEFAGKRVLIVGAGNSGADIACDAAFAAKQTFISIRRGYHFVPKYIMGQPTDVFARKGAKLPDWISTPAITLILNLMNGNVARYGFPKPDHKLFQSHPLMNTQILHYVGHGDCVVKPDIARLDGHCVEFVDGSREQVDLIIAATGYKHDIPFLDPADVDKKKGRPDLYLGMFSRKHSNLAFLGFVEFSSAAYANFDQMAELIAADAAANAESALKEKLSKMKKTHKPDLTAGHRYVDSQRHANYVHIDTYRAALAQVKKQVGLSLSA